MNKVSSNKIEWWQPVIGSNEYDLVNDVLKSGFLNDGKVTDQFEKEVAQLLGAQYAVAVTSGTAALYLALKACDIGHGDEVIVPDTTFIATANAVVMTGAVPRLVDIDRQTLNIDPAQIQKAINSKTKAIIPVHVSGRLADMTTIMDIAQKHNLAVIEDAAEAFGSKQGGKSAGTIGHMGCFSFSPNKTITTGQGGMVITNDSDLHQKLRQLKDQGRPHRGTGGDDEHPAIGYNFKLTNLQAAVGLGQMQDIQARLSKLKLIYKTYERELKGVKGISLFPFDVEQGESPQWIDAYVEDRDSLAKAFDNHGIGFRRFWFAIHSQLPYKLPDNQFPIASHCAEHCLWLPSSLSLTEEDIKEVCKLIKQTCGS
jgi:perosamine synthetase